MKLDFRRLDHKWTKLKIMAKRLGPAATKEFRWARKSIVRLEGVHSEDVKNFWYGHETAITQSLDHVLRLMAKSKEQPQNSSEG